MDNKSSRKLLAQDWYNFFVLKKDITKSVKDLVKESWIRSRENEIDCFNQFIQEKDVENCERSIKENHFLIDVARPYIDELYKIINTSKFMITLLDKKGFVLDSLVNPTVANNSDCNVINLSEDRIGTNAMGTCLYLDKPVQTWAEEHCYKALQKFTTSAAPIHDIHGNLIGCIGITGFANGISVHTLGMAMSISYAIENKIRLSQDKHSTLLKSYANSINHSISDGLIIVDCKGQITSLNKAAESFLHIRESEALCLNIKDLLGAVPGFNKSIDEGREILNKKALLHVTDKTKQYNISMTKLKSGLIVMGYVILINKIDNKIDMKHDTPKSRLYVFEDIIGDSDSTKETIYYARIASHGNSNVLLIGESGTGKELFAQSIHSNSFRKNGPFIEINCGALPLGLAESELFGYEGGAYTGSKREGQKGKFELADGGTLFLDEIGELPLSIQAALLRVIQERKVTRIGSTNSKYVDVMIIAATNKNLFHAVQNKTFREDLFYRLNVFTINLAPLRERKEDISNLTKKFIERYNIAFNKDIEGISDEAWGIFLKYDWPGNIREFENVIERAVQIAQSDKIEARDLPIYLTVDIDINKTNKENISAIESQKCRAIIQELKKTKGNIKLASETLGISRATIYRKLSNLGKSINDFRDN